MHKAAARVKSTPGVVAVATSTPTLVGKELRADNRANPQKRQIEFIQWSIGRGDHRVYLVRFTEKTTGKTFLKLGRTCRPLEVRFAPDLERFQMEPLYETPPMALSGAAMVEARMLQAFSKAKKIGRMLKSGNTECFVSFPGAVKKATKGLRELMILPNGGVESLGVLSSWRAATDCKSVP